MRCDEKINFLRVKIKKNDCVLKNNSENVQVAEQFLTA